MRYLIAVMLTLCASAAGAAPTTRFTLRENWRMKSSALVDEDGAGISLPSFRPEQWYPATAPTTVLNALTKNGVYPDMRIGLNCYRIPDASDEFNRQHDLARFSYLPDKRNPWKDPYWFRTTFDLEKLAPNQRAWLHFKCINYRADVFLNGRQIADREHMAGMFQRYSFDVTDAARAGQNALAVRIQGVDHPGVPDQQLKVFGRERGFFKEIMRDVTEIMTIGYDCMPTVPDRNMGIIQDVELEVTGPVVIRDPFVVTDLPLPEMDRAVVKISATVRNASATMQKAMLHGMIVETGQKFEVPLSLGAGESMDLAIDPITVQNPRLWWPVNYGPQNLYHLNLSVEATGGVSHAQTVTFGIRHIQKVLHERNGADGMQLHINGQRIFCRGGYIQPEILFDWGRKKWETEVRYFTSANLNLIYFEDIPNPPDEYLDLCDKYGLMFGNCFYSCMWLKPNTPYPDDMGLLTRGTIDIVKRYRNHPCMWLYMAMNEGDTKEPVYAIWRKAVTELDGTRIIIPSAYFPSTRKDAPAWFKQDLPTGMTDIGASYGWQDPASYFRLVRENPNWMFMMESGSASLPPISSLRKFLPDIPTGTAPASPTTQPAAPFPLAEAWAHHGANHYYTAYDQALRRMFGQPRTVAEYCWRGHLTTADQHRAMFEAFNHRMWDITSGLTQWKINACWPSVQWQIFDWYHKPMVSYYYIRRACEPVHVQLNLIDNMVAVINNRLEAQKDLTVRARVFGLDSKLLWEKRAKIDVAANSYAEVFILEKPAGLPPAYFVRLDLADAQGKAMSDNFYWLPRRPGDSLAELDKLPMVKLRTESRVERTGDKTMVQVKITNPTSHIAFFTQLAASRDGQELVPVFWTDNYFSLLPGESKAVSAELPSAGAAGIDVEVGGWNIETDFECKGMAMSKGQTDGSSTITATVARTFIDGSRVMLFLDDRPERSVFVQARGMEQAQIEFPVRAAPGPHAIRVGNEESQVRLR